MTKPSITYPPAQNRYMQENILGELFLARIHAGPVFALTRIHEHVFEGSFAAYSQILEGIHFGANTCRACIRTRSNTGKYSWRIIYVLVSCQGSGQQKVCVEVLAPIIGKLRSGI